MPAGRTLVRLQVIEPDDSDLDAAAFNVADNRTHEFADWDEPALAKLLNELRTERC